MERTSGPPEPTAKSLAQAGRSSAAHRNGNDDTAMTRTEKAITAAINSDGGAAIKGGERSFAAITSRSARLPEAVVGPARLKIRYILFAFTSCRWLRCREKGFSRDNYVCL